MNSTLSTDNAYRELNLPQGASEREIKTAFRRLAKDCHPDGQGSVDVDKFRRAYNAYRSLMKSFHIDNSNFAKSAEPSLHFVFDGRRSMGLDVYYDLALVKPDFNLGFKLVIPTEAFTACPRCLGQGQTLGPLNAGSNVYRPQVCPKCHGLGSIKTFKNLAVTITREMAEKGKFRLKGAGAYLPKQARRGDLIVSLRFVDQLPKGH
ncbi:MAG: DnaJ domain-containing protein [Deltaproteobacteria bacterium]|jgi:DnaJ-class molecular chaperone|nr:DnaJ domain-containing protein [Deltaproteobacteria bacterium]